VKLSLRWIVLNRRILAKQVLRGNLLDRGIVEDGLESPLQPFDVLGLGCHEKVEIFRRPGQTEQVDRDGAEDDVPDAFSLQRRKDLLCKLQLHGGQV